MIIIREWLLCTESARCSTCLFHRKLRVTFGWEWQSTSPHLSPTPPWITIVRAPNRNQKRRSWHCVIRVILRDRIDPSIAVSWTAVCCCLITIVPLLGRRSDCTITNSFTPLSSALLSLKSCLVFLAFCTWGMPPKRLGSNLGKCAWSYILPFIRWWLLDFRCIILS